VCLYLMVTPADEKVLRLIMSSHCSVSTISIRVNTDDTHENHVEIEKPDISYGKLFFKYVVCDDI